MPTKNSHTKQIETVFYSITPLIFIIVSKLSVL